MWKFIVNFELVFVNDYMPSWNSQYLFLGRTIDAQLNEKNQAGDTLFNLIVLLLLLLVVVVLIPTIYHCSFCFPYKLLDLSWAVFRGQMYLL